MNWTEYFRTLANHIKLKSKDQSTKIGAVLVNDDHSIVSTGYNSFPRGIRDDVPERQERPEKYFWMAHSEMNAVVNAARMGSATLGTTMYLSCSCPCTNCARVIINAGVKKIWCERDDTTANPAKWNEEAARSIVMFSEAGVDVEYYANQ